MSHQGRSLPGCALPYFLGTITAAKDFALMGKTFGTSIAIGIALGAAIGAVLGNIVIGIAIGIAIGAGLGGWKRPRGGSGPDDAPP